MSKEVSIVSSTYRSVADTKAFVESVQKNTKVPYELIMAVNGPVDEDLAQYAKFLELRGDAKILWNPDNIGVRSFGQVMHLANTDFIFRCDSDIVIQEEDWTTKMIDQLTVSNQELGGVAAVGTSNTHGHMIRRSPHTIEVDKIMSNCMLIWEPAVREISAKLLTELPRMSEYYHKKLAAKSEGYEGELGDLEATLRYAAYHAPYWDVHFGGLNEALGYGSDDIWWSILARWAGLKLVTSDTRVFHKDASARPEYKEERHRLVFRGFQYLRTSLSLIMDEWRQEKWMELPNNLPVLVEYRNSGEQLTRR